MIIDETYKGRVRITNEGIVSCRTVITDIESGERITNIFRALINLDVESCNVAQLTFYAQDTQGKFRVDEHDDLISPTIQVRDSVVDLQACSMDVQPR